MFAVKLKKKYVRNLYFHLQHGLEKNYSLKKSEVLNTIEKLVEHGIHFLPSSYANDVKDLSS